MLNIRNLFRREARLDYARPQWTPPFPVLNIAPSDVAQAAFGLFTANTGYSLDDFIQMRLKRLQAINPHTAIAAMNCRYRTRDDDDSDIPATFQLIFDELNDWMQDGRDAEAVRPLVFLAACMWRAGELDKAASAGGWALDAVREGRVSDPQMNRLAQGFHALGMFYWGIDLMAELLEAQELGSDCDDLLGAQFSVNVLQALAQLEIMRGDLVQAQRFSYRATFLASTSSLPRLPEPAWQVKTAPGGPYGVDSVEPPMVH